jgi:hypothetical protein
MRSGTEVIALLLSLPAVPWAGPSQRTQAVTTGQPRLLQIGPDLAVRRRSRTDPGPRPCLQACDPGPHWGRTRPDDHGQQRIATVSRPHRSVAVCERSPRSFDHPDCLSHRGSRPCPGPTRPRSSGGRSRTATEATDNSDAGAVRRDARLARSYVGSDGPIRLLAVGMGVPGSRGVGTKSGCVVGCDAVGFAHAITGWIGACGDHATSLQG